MTGIPPTPTPPISPLPKWVGVLAAIGVLAGSAQAALADPAVSTFISPKVAAVIASICGLLILLSHSLTGTGGK
jgi:hypothetical protein